MGFGACLLCLSIAVDPCGVGEKIKLLVTLAKILKKIAISYKKPMYVCTIIKFNLDSKSGGQILKYGFWWVVIVFVYWGRPILTWGKNKITSHLI